MNFCTQYPGFADTSLKKEFVKYIYTKLDIVNPVARSTSHVMSFLSEQISVLNTQITQLRNELDRKLLEQ